MRTYLSYIRPIFSLFSLQNSRGKILAKSIVNVYIITTMKVLLEIEHATFPVRHLNFPKLVIALFSFTYIVVYLQIIFSKYSNYIYIYVYIVFQNLTYIRAILPENLPPISLFKCGLAPSISPMRLYSGTSFSRFPVLDPLFSVSHVFFFV